MGNIKSAIKQIIAEEKARGNKRRARELTEDEVYFFKHAHEAQISILATARAYHKIFGERVSRSWVVSVYERLGLRN